MGICRDCSIVFFLNCLSDIVVVLNAIFLYHCQFEAV